MQPLKKVWVQFPLLKSGVTNHKSNSTRSDGPFWANKYCILMLTANFVYFKLKCNGIIYPVPFPSFKALPCLFPPILLMILHQKKLVTSFSLLLLHTYTHTCTHIHTHTKWLLNIKVNALVNVYCCCLPALALFLFLSLIPRII